MTIGKFYDLKVLRIVDFGVYLDSDLGDILLPMKYVPEGTQVDSIVSVFLHKDSEDRLLATTLRPAGVLGDFVALEVTDTAPHGAFMDWGLEKDLFVPNNEQPQAYNVGDIHVVKICYDYKTERLLGVGKINAFLEKDTSELDQGQEVELLIYGKTELGFQALVNKKYSGLIYANEVFQNLKIGDNVIGYIQKLRDDGKLDLRVGKVGVEAIDENAQVILTCLKDNGGFVDLTDKSSPDNIKGLLNLSKKSFKKALGSLYKQRQVDLRDDGIYLLD